MSMTFIRRFIYSLPDGKIFTTRDCIGFGLRSAVDVALHRLVYLGIIIRLARGVFVRADKDLRKIHAREVAEEKAKAFGKEIINHSANEAKEFGLIAGKSARYLFHVNSGQSSSFGFGISKMRFRGTSHRRMRLGESKTGKIARAFWHCGKKAMLEKKKEGMDLRLNRVDREELRKSLRWMPSWLGELLVPDRTRWIVAQREL
jgi:hypothetical protein